MGRYKIDPEWREKADIFLEDAARHLSESHYRLICFKTHQAAELYLKSIIVSLTGSHPYTHDLSELLEILARVGFSTSEALMTAADLLTPITNYRDIQARDHLDTIEKELTDASSLAERLWGELRGLRIHELLLRYTIESFKNMWMSRSGASENSWKKHLTSFPP